MCPLRPPLAVAVAVRLWDRGRWGPLAAVVVVALVTADWGQLSTQPVLVIAALPVCVIWQRGLAQKPAREDWPARSATAALVAAGVFLLVTNGVLVGALLGQGCLQHRAIPTADLQAVLLSRSHDLPVRTDSSNGFAQGRFPRLPVLGPVLLPSVHGSALCVLSQHLPAH